MSTELKQQAPALAFPSGDSRPIAVLVDEPSALSLRLGVSFADGLDDLDRFFYAIIELGGDRKAVLYKHFGDPNPGAAVRVDANTDPALARQEPTAKLSLSRADVPWWSPEA